MKRFARRVAMVLASVGVACDQAPPERSNDTPVVVLAPPDTATAPAPSVAAPFMDVLGPAFLIHADGPTTAIVVDPAVDSSADLDEQRRLGNDLRQEAVELFVSGRLVAQATVDSAVRTEPVSGCVGWPMVRIVGADSLRGGWTIAFPRGRVQAVVVDSVATWGRNDSLRTVREIARLASSAPGDTLESLRGVPYVVQRAYVTRLPDSTELLLAEVTRALNQEANPVAETLLLLAERTAGAWRRVYLERETGSEESLPSVVPMFFGLATRTGTPVIVLERDLGDGVRYSVLGRAADGTWALRWLSAYAGC